MQHQGKSKRERRGHVLPQAPLISLDQPGRLLTRHVLALSGWSHSKLYKKLKEASFPAPEKDGRVNYWTTDTVRAALGLSGVTP
ncbi:hypothetical protein [Lysobacter sp. A3-1-A15]|uniref:hypothetical protein n=1 Tax=Novilysobacter viscosus TaxID=3098602 RepID=UPI002EDB0C9D